MARPEYNPLEKMWPQDGYFEVLTDDAGWRLARVYGHWSSDDCYVGDVAGRPIEGVLLWRDAEGMA